MALKAKESVENEHTGKHSILYDSFIGSGKRSSIRQRIQSMVLVMITVSLAINSLIGIVSMLRTKNEMESILRDRLTSNLLNIVELKAAVADNEFERYSGYVSSLADYINELYKNPENYVPKEVDPPDPSDSDRFSMKRYLADKSVSYADVADECGLLGNAEYIFAPITKSGGEEILAIYISTESGLQISYDTDSEITAHSDGGEVYFDYYDRPWYGLAQKAGKVCFTDVYEDTYNRGYMITCAAPFYKPDGDFAGVVCMDMLIDDLYDVLVDFDMLPGNEDYAFLVDSSGAAVSTQFRDRQMNIITDKSINDEICINILNGVTDVSYNQTDSYYAYAPIKGVGWKLVLHVPRSYIQTPIDNIHHKMIASVLMYLFVFVALSFVIYWVVKDFARGITEPLYMLRQDAKVISNGDLDHEIKVITNDEIGDLAVSFNHMAISLKDYIANLTQVTAEKEKIGAELNVAAQIQSDMLPSIFPPFPEKKEFDLYATMDPAKEVGGDFYDFFLIDDDHLCMVMADVSGKGVPAALFMVITKTLIKNRAQLGGSPSEILEYANDQLCVGNEAELFVTVWVAILEISTGKGVAANAGHEHPVLMRAGGEYELIKYKHSPAVATIEGIPFKEHEFELHKGDRLFVYTDGVPEATDSDNELFGTDRMLDVLNANKESTVEDTLVNIKKAMDKFVGDAPQFDDITMLVFNYYGK